MGKTFSETTVLSSSSPYNAKFEVTRHCIEVNQPAFSTGPRQGLHSPRVSCGKSYHVPNQGSGRDSVGVARRTRNLSSDQKDRITLYATKLWRVLHNFYDKARRPE